MALSAAERIRNAIERLKIPYCNELINITVSIGVAEPHAEDMHAADIVRRADQALYRAKMAGRNRVLTG